MHLEINDATAFRQIQETFSNYYPYLEIEFFYKPHKKYEHSQETDQINPNNIVGDIKLTHEKFSLFIRLLMLRRNLWNSLDFLFKFFVKKKTNGNKHLGWMIYNKRVDRVRKEFF